MKTGTGSRRRGFALVSIGLVLGGALWASPATSHVAGWTHNWVQHIRPKADARYYTKANANARYFTKTQADARYYTQAQADARYYTQAQADARYAPASTAASGRLVTGFGEGTVLNVDGNVIYGRCGSNGGSVEYQNQTGAATRIMGPSVTGEVLSPGVRNFGSQTPVTPIVYTVQIASGPSFETITTFTVSWTGSSGTCEYFAQAVTAG